MKTNSPRSFSQHFGIIATKTALAVLVMAALAPHAAFAAKKKVSAKAGVGTPSAQIDPLLTACLEAITAPLDKDPRMPRIEVEKLRASFAADQIKADAPHQRQILQNAMAVCDALTNGMDERAKEVAAAVAGGKMPVLSNGSSIVKSSPIRGRDAGANAEAIRKKQGNERNYSDKEAREKAAFLESGFYKAWTDKSTRLRQGIMVVYTRQKQLEAYDEKEATQQKQPEAAITEAKTRPAPPQQAVSTAKKTPSLAGTWTGDNKTTAKVDINEDHTVTKVSETGKKLTGTWSVSPEGEFIVEWGGNGAKHHAKLSADGRTLDFRINKWTRQ